MLRRLLVPLLAALLLLASADAADAAKRSRPADRVALAAKLAGDLRRATTDDRRRAALLRVFSALRVGVYSGRGRPIVRGTERSAGDVYLYDAEVRAIAAGLGRGQRIDPAGLVQRVSRLRLAPRGGPLTGPRLERALTAGLRRARRERRAPRSLAGLLVAELGRRAKRPVTGRGAAYDPLQSWLILAELATGRRGGGSARPRQAGAPAPCFTGSGRVARIVSGFGALVQDFDTILKVATHSVASPLHGLTIAALFDVQPTQGGQVLSTHYGGPHHPLSGRELVFRIGAQMVAQLPDRVIRCGPLAGLTFPKKGPIAGLPVDWDGSVSDGLATLRAHGTITQQDAVTDANGIATLRFTPHREIVAGAGRERVAAGALQPEVSVLSGLGNVPGNINEVLFPFFTTIGFGIGYHEARGFRFSAETPELCFTLGSCDEHAFRYTHTYSARVCGPTPYGVPWDGTEITVERIGEEVSSSIERFEFVLRPGETSTTYPRDAIGRNDQRFDFRLIEHVIDPLMQVDTFYANNFEPGSENYRAYESHVPARVEEDLSCPPLP